MKKLSIVLAIFFVSVLLAKQAVFYLNHEVSANIGKKMFDVYRYKMVYEDVTVYKNLNWYARYELVKYYCEKQDDLISASEWLRVRSTVVNWFMNEIKTMAEVDNYINVYAPAAITKLKSQATENKIDYRSVIQFYIDRIDSAISYIDFRILLSEAKSQLLQSRFKAMATAGNSAMSLRFEGIRSQQWDWNKIHEADFKFLANDQLFIKEVASLGWPVTYTEGKVNPATDDSDRLYMVKFFERRIRANKGDVSILQSWRRGLILVSDLLKNELE